MKTDQFVSVIVPVYNNLLNILKCLKALESQTYDTGRYEVLVVDNGSDENIEQIALSFSHVKYIREDKRGSYVARNKGISISKGDILAFTDSDCIPHADWIEKGVNHLLRESHCGLIAGKIQLFPHNPNNLTPIELFELCNSFDQKKYIEKDHYGVTANLFTFRHIFEKIGYFNSNFISGGDVEWGKRVFAAGYKQIYIEDIIVEHPARRTFMQWFVKTVRLLQGVSDLGEIKLSVRKLLILIIPPERQIRRILFDNVYEDVLKNKKDRIKVVMAYIFDHYVWVIGGLIVIVRNKIFKKKRTKT